MIRRQLGYWTIPLISSSVLHLGIVWVALGMAIAWAPRLPAELPVDLIEPEPLPREIETPRPPPAPRPKPVEVAKPIPPPPLPTPPRQSPPAVEPPPVAAPPPSAPQVAPKVETAAVTAAVAPVSPVEPRPSDTKPTETLLSEVKPADAAGVAALPQASTAPPAAVSTPREGGAPAGASAQVAAAPSKSAAPIVAARASEVTQAARPRGGYQVIPPYPASARRQHVEGTAILRVLVLPDGHVGTISVQKSAGHPDLDQAATDAVRQWRFDPARKGTEPVAMWVLLPVEFHLKD